MGNEINPNSRLIYGTDCYVSKTLTMDLSLNYFIQHFLSNDYDAID